MKKPTWRELLREYSNPPRTRAPLDNNFGGRAGVRMSEIAGRLMDNDPSPTQEEVVRVLRDIAGKTNVLDQVHMISHGTSGDVAHYIPEGATNRQIIDMIEKAPEQTE